MSLVPQQHSDTSILLRATAIFWLVAKAISFKVWTVDRVFPVVPVFDLTEGIPAWVHFFLFLASMFCLFALLIKPKLKIVGYVLMATELCSVLLDYTRWQPWEYQYLFILFIFLVNRNDAHIRVAIGFLLAALYFYSGLHKINTGFLVQVWDNMILNSLLHLSNTVKTNTLLFYSGYILGVLEMCGGLALLFKRTQKIAAIFLVAMHLFNLLWLGPLGANYNIIIWPWNMIMCIYLVLVFIKGRILSFKPLFIKENLAVLLAWGIFPMLNFAGLWDHYLSGSLYSGKLPLMSVCINTDSDLQPYISKSDLRNLCPEMKLVKLQSWALKELKVPPYPQKRVYTKVAKYLHQQYPGCMCYGYTYADMAKKEVIE